jgi:hypothetical protein
MGDYERYAVPQYWVNALRARLLGGGKTRKRFDGAPLRRCPEARNRMLRAAGEPPQRAFTIGRALLRLKPSRISESMGDYERYAVPYRWVNALRARLLGAPTARAAWTQEHKTRYTYPSFDTRQERNR